MNKRRLIAGALSASLLVSAMPGLALAQDEEPFAAEGVEWVLDTHVGRGHARGRRGHAVPQRR